LLFSFVLVVNAIWVSGSNAALILATHYSAVNSSENDLRLLVPSVVFVEAELLLAEELPLVFALLSIANS
jgi:hypothetical protein